MSDTATTLVKKTTRTRKTSALPSETTSDMIASPLLKTIKSKEEAFTHLLEKVTSVKEEFEQLQKNIKETTEAWIKEQKDHDIQLQERNTQEEITQKRERETYEYETMLKRRQTEDEFLEKKHKWEKELQERKEELENDKKELENLRKQVAGFEEEVGIAVKEATSILQKDLTEQFANEKKLREQEVKAEKDLLTLRITNLSQENSRQAQEIEALKKSVDDATRQLKEVAVKVIESASQPPKNTPSDL